MSVTRTSVLRALGNARRVLLAVSVGLSLFSIALPAQAWSGRGHAMIADIAARLLTPAAAAEVAALLLDDRFADGKPSNRTTLAQVAGWPDELRSTAEQRATGVYHYDDIPICTEAERVDYCPDGRCGSAWLERQIAVLGDHTQSHRARNEALKWVTHLVGDLHEPLHAADHGDKGGNDVRVSFLGAQADEAVGGRQPPPYNLHSTWDRLIPLQAIDHEGGYEAFLSNGPTESTRVAWEAGSIEAWTQESHFLAREFVYAAIPGFSCGASLSDLVVLDEAYDHVAEPIAAAQLRKAGVRLAEVLNAALKEPPP